MIPIKYIAVLVFIGFVFASGFGTAYYMFTVDMLEVEIDTRNNDNKKAKAINKETSKQLADKAVAKVVTKYVNLPAKECENLTDEEITNMCVNEYVPVDLLQSIRDKISRARGRLD